jgi:hypothetical protein
MKILLLTDIPPCNNHTSGLVINSWCDFLLEDGHEIYCALIENSDLNPDIPKEKIEKITFLKIDKPREYWGLSEGVKFQRIKENLNSLYHNNLIRIIHLPKIASKVSMFAKEKNCELILASIQGQTMTQLVRKVARKTNLEYVAQTWDPLEWWMKVHKFDPITKFFNMREFGLVIKNAKNFMAMSWAMSLESEKKYSTKSITNIPGLKKGKLLSRKDQRRKKNFVISLAGQLYAKEEFDVLVEVLERMNWSYNGKRISINLYGREFDFKYHNVKGIKIHGYVPQEKLITLLAASDLLYCPYWFSKEYEKACRISFPAKLVTFLKTGKPVLMHSPKYASPRVLLENSNASYICGSLNVDEMVDVLKSIIDDKNRDKVGIRGYKLFEKYMTYDSMKKSLLVSLGLMDKKVIEEFESVRKIYKE